jgi:6-phosphogluconolactonase (cycloisomerase 2 family)
LVNGIGCGGGSLPSPGLTPVVQVALTETAMSLLPGATHQFTATVTGTSNTAVTWSVNDIAGGNATVGTITAGGLFTAPAILPNPSAVTVKAASMADSTKFASATVTIVAPLQVTLSPLTLTVQTGATLQFTATVTGTSNTAVTWSVNDIAGGNATVGTITAGGLFTAPAILPNPSAVTVKAASMADSTKFASATITIVAPLQVTLSPLTPTVQTGATLQFTATVTGTSNTAVTWSVNDIAGGNITMGTISAEGLFTAPAAVPNPNIVMVTAASAVDPTKSASTTVTIAPLIYLAGLQPFRVTVGSSGLTLTLIGSNFDPGSLVQWNGSSRATTFVNSSELTADIPASDLATQGAAEVSVLAPALGGLSTNTLLLAIVSTVPRFAYVSNPFTNDVSGFTVDASTGTLTPMPVTSFAAGTTPRQVVVDPFGRFAYAVNSGSDDVSGYTIDQNSGILSAIGSFAAGTTPLGASVDPYGRFLYVVNSVSNNISAYSIDSNTGILSEIQGSPFDLKVDPANSPIHVVLDASGRFFYYTISELYSGVNCLTRDEISGELSDRVCSGGGAFHLPAGVFVDSSGSVAFATAYSMDYQLNDLESFPIDPASGNLGYWAILYFGSLPQLLPDPAANFLFVAADDWNGVSLVPKLYVYQIDTTTANLSAIPGSPYARHQTTGLLAVDLSGLFLYTFDSGTSSIGGFQIDPSTGTLTPFSTSWAVATSPSSMVVSP